MILGKGQMPAAVRGHRIMVKPAPPVQESDIIIKPEAYEYLPNKGVVVAAGLNALDTMYDHGDLIGDEVWWGKFAGVIEEWDHVIEEGAVKCNEHGWTAVASGQKNNRRWQCVCGAIRLAEHMLVMNVDDLLANVSLERRLESGEVAIKRGKTPDGRTHHYIDRKDQ